MLTSAKVVNLLEMLYGTRSPRPESLGAWLPRVVPLLGESLGDRAAKLGFSVIDMSTRRFVFLSFQHINDSRQFARTMRQTFERIDGDVLSSLYRDSHPVQLLGQLVDFAQNPVGQLAAAEGAVDALGLISEPEPGFGCAAYRLVERPVSLARNERSVLTRLAMHVETAVRVRLRRSKPIGYVTVEGRLETDDREGPTSPRVAAHVKAVEAIRGRRRRADGDAALRLWAAIVDGKYSLVERIDTDGQRLYDVFENAPRSARFRALSPREAQVLDRAARGMTSKEIAFALGVGPSAVANAFASAGAKTGLLPRALVRLAGGLGGTGSLAARDELTPAELDVARLVAAGLTNAEIGRRRATSVRTVAAQVASILGKTGASSRRSLIAASRMLTTSR